jgi:WD40 repeat protein
MRRIRSLIIHICIVTVAIPDVGMSTAAWARELPGEGTLPGQVRPTSKKNLPPESALPGIAMPGFAGQQQVSVQRQLPSENELPGTLIVQKTSPTVVGEPLLDDDAGIPSPSDTQPEPKPAQAPAAIGQAPRTFPWLRLNMDGHTGTVRVMTFSRDGSRLFTGGDDKALEVWNRLEVGAEKPRWVHERTVRWQVHRGPRGRIQAVAASADSVAIAGYGAMSEMGEILLIDPVTGALKRSLFNEKIGHRQPIVSMSFAPGGQRLASQDISGRAMLWTLNAETGLWTAQILSPPDREQYGEQTTKLLEPMRRLSPIVMLGDNAVVLPIYYKQMPANDQPEGVVSWHLQRIELPSLKRTNLNASVPRMEHGRMVTALAASPDGKRLVSADTYANLHFWNLENGIQGKKVPQNVAITSLSFANNGRRLVAGCGKSRRRDGNAAVQLWNLDDPANPRLGGDLAAANNADAVALSPTGEWVAYSQGTAVELKRTAEFTGRTSESLLGRARPVLRVAFAAQEPYYRVAFGTQPQASGVAAFERSFDLENVQLQAAPELRETDWLRPTAAQGQWSVVSTPEPGGTVSHWLYQGKEKAARLPLRSEVHGQPTATFWLAGRNNQPAAVAVGTSLQNLIYVFQLPAQGEARVLRQFRGHEGTIRSISVSRDGRYLVSSADDATIRVWNLTGFAKDSETVNRWGAEFELQNGQLVVQSIREDGPIYFRGVRAADTITALGWWDGKQWTETNKSGEMLAILRGEIGKKPVAFYYRRGEQVQPAFNQYAAWQPLASIFVADNRDWAFWTPAGYYDASFDGHKLFGWQVNPENLATLPEFFLAAQFQQALERPQVMAQLLRAGSLEAAFRAVRQMPPGDAENAVLDQYRLKPRVEILSPQPDTKVANSRTKIQAAITVRDGLQLTPPKAFANGVVANNRRLVSEKVVSGGREMHFEWDAQLPSDPRVVVQVVASTDAAVVDTQSVVVRHEVTPAPRQPKLYIVAAGINQYRDAQIQRLDYAVSNARSVVESLRGHAKSLYKTEATMLLDNQATRPMWSVITRESADRLRQEAQADDLLVFFLSGHGVRDEDTQKYYFVAADARFDDVKAGRFSGCLSFEDFAAFADVPCRKLVVLDTCHSGAVQQPLRQQDLKAALRALQTDVVFTMTASDGSQEASEQKEKKLGRFTARLLEALSGVADRTDQGGDGNKVVTLNEAFRYVSAAVPADSKGDEQVQHPTVGPIDLLDYAVLPLTKARE